MNVSPLIGWLYSTLPINNEMGHGGPKIRSMIYIHSVWKERGGGETIPTPSSIHSFPIKHISNTHTLSIQHCVFFSVYHYVSSLF